MLTMLFRPQSDNTLQSPNVVVRELIAKAEKGLHPEKNIFCKWVNMASLQQIAWIPLMASGRPRGGFFPLMDTEYQALLTEIK